MSSPAQKHVSAGRNGLLIEPPVRIELTTARLQGECSTTELRRPEEAQFIGVLRRLLVVVDDAL